MLQVLGVYLAISIYCTVIGNIFERWICRAVDYTIDKRHERHWREIMPIIVMSWIPIFNIAIALALSLMSMLGLLLLVLHPVNTYKYIKGTLAKRWIRSGEASTVLFINALHTLNIRSQKTPFERVTFANKLWQSLTLKYHDFMRYKGYK